MKKLKANQKGNSKMAQFLPSVKAYERGDDFEKWMKAVERYMSAIDIKKIDQKISMVLHMLGPELQDIYDNLPDVERIHPNENAYELMKKKLSSHFKPQVNAVVERHVFHTMEYEGGPVVEYVAKMRSQAKKCEFENVDDIIRDKLVTSCPFKSVKEAMLKEKELDLNKAMKIWCTDEFVKREVKKMERKRKEQYEGEVSTIKRNKLDNNKNESRKCYRCGRGNHLVKDCRVPNYVKCYNCHQQGHLKHVCKSSTKPNENKPKSTPRVNACEELDHNSTRSSEEQNDDLDNFCVYNV